MMRRARKEDAKQIAPLVHCVLSDMELPILKESSREKFLYVLEKAIETKDHRYSYTHTSVYEENNEILGVVVCYKGELEESVDKPWTDLAKRYDLGTDTPLFLNKETEKGEYYIDTVVVSKNARRRGIGKILVEHAFVMAKEENQSIVGLNCDKVNEKARNLYEKYGFKSKVEKVLSGHEYYYMNKVL